MDNVYNQLNLKNKSDPIITTADKSFDAEELALKYLARAYKKIKEKIIKRIGTKDKKLEEYVSSIIEKTEAKMKQVYTLDPPIDTGHYFVESAQTDFIDWLMRIWSIPLYQSLGDTIGYRNGDWEFNHGEKEAGPEYANEMIGEFIHLGGINGLSIANWIASDDTLFYMETFVTLMQKLPSIQDYGSLLKQNYLRAWPQMENRAPGRRTAQSIQIQQNPNFKWDQLPYDPTAIGNGSAMRTGCVGIFYPGKSNRKKLIALATEASRITHNSAIAILGSITTALFTAYAIERVPIAHWPHRLLKFLDSGKIDLYVEKSRPLEAKMFTRDKSLYRSRWQSYVNFRFAGASLVPRMDKPIMQKPVERIRYLSQSYSANQKNPGSCADDACIIAYDSLLESGDNLEKLLVYSILHNGDSDTVGSIAFSWFGAYYYSKSNDALAESRFKQLEFYKVIGAKNSIATRTKLFKVYYYDLYVHYARKFIKRIPI